MNANARRKTQTQAKVRHEVRNFIGGKDDSQRAGPSRLSRELLGLLGRLHMDLTLLLHKQDDLAKRKALSNTSGCVSAGRVRQSWPRFKPQLIQR